MTSSLDTILSSYGLGPQGSDDPYSPLHDLACATHCAEQIEHFSGLVAKWTDQLHWHFYHLYLAGESMQFIADQFDLSRQRVYQIIQERRKVAEANA